MRACRDRRSRWSAFDGVCAPARRNGAAHVLEAACPRIAREQVHAYLCGAHAGSLAAASRYRRRESMAKRAPIQRVYGTAPSRVPLGHPRADRGRARRNRGAPSRHPAPHARTRAPTSPWRTAASPSPPALAQAPTAGRPSRPTANAPLRRPARRARPAPRRGSGAAARSRPCSSWSGTNSDAKPIAVLGLPVVRSICAAGWGGEFFLLEQFSPSHPTLP